MVPRTNKGQKDGRYLEGSWNSLVSGSVGGGEKKEGAGGGAGSFSRNTEA